ncbi:MAG: epoxyqueuosine reductase [Solirubrobacteraceae bacterium]|nr:epoxyqueuosine reductase [Solirubrobacteraceae bacterium]
MVSALPQLMAPIPADATAAELQREAQALGFVVAWAPVELPQAWKDGYHEWVAERRNAGLGHLARALEVRLDPTARFAWARSAMVLAAPHAYADPGAPPDGVRPGRVARRFWVREPDPFTLKRLLEPSIEALKDAASQLGVRCRDYIDQGPLPVNLYAVSSGAFWRGRNAMPNHPLLGTFVTLTCLLTDLEVAAPDEHPDRCGSCTTCVDSCPTGALLGDRRVDLNRCISYWTTSHQGPIPPEMWDDVGDWVLGCDTCQDVCPWNGRGPAPPRAWRGFEAEPQLAHPDLRDPIAMSTTAFARAYADSGFERLGRPRIARNALVVLANTRHPDAVDLATLATRDTAPLVRATAARALVRLGRRDAAAGLLADADAMVRGEAELALGS